MVKKRPHCVVIGAGIVGSSCAWHLVMKGAKVTLIDSERPGQGASFGNAGCICKSAVFPFSHPGAIRKVPGWLLDPHGPMRIRWSYLLPSMPWLYHFWRAGKANRVAQIVRAQVTLMNNVIDDYDHILAETGGEALRKSRGMILLYDTAKDFARDQWKYEFRERLGFPWQRLTRDELTALEPCIHLGEGIAVFEPEWQHLIDPGAVTQRIADAAFERGASWLHDRVRTVSANADGVSLLTESGRSLEADWLVIAAGVWSNAVIGQLGYKVPLISKRGYHSMVAKPNLEIHHPIMSASRHVLLTPMRAGLRVSGTAEFAGLDTKPDYRRAKSLMQNARYYVPDLDGEEITEWMGQRPMLPDSLPVLGPLPGQQNVLCAFGHGHYGLTQGPTTGRIISKLVFAEDPGIDLLPFSISRFRNQAKAISQ
ncbi:MAG: FAD-binding oxidoreductase [Proteobacteria bacterium]|nr:FAD-binding oxidoreductase [Pseudomonadota bacterium]